MLDFAWPWAFAALPLPLAAAWLVPRAEDSPAPALRIPFFAAARRWSAGAAGRRARGLLALAAAAWVALVVAAARPQWVGPPSGVAVTGRDLMLAVDISGSMKNRDLGGGTVRHTRLRVVKDVAGEFIERRRGDRIGLILFGTRAYLQTPLTFDRDTVRALLEEAVVGLAGEQTAIGDAIGLAVKRLRGRAPADRVLVLLTDGANTAGAIDPVAAAGLAARAGLRVYTVGVGSTRLAAPGRPGAGARSTDLDEQVLARIAERTGGRFFRARDRAELAEIYRLLDAIEPASAEHEALRRVDELYHLPLAGALALVLALLAGPRPLARWRAGGDVRRTHAGA